MAPDRPFGVGLRLSAVAAATLAAAGRARGVPRVPPGERPLRLHDQRLPVRPVPRDARQGGGLPAGLARRGAPRVHATAWRSCSPRSCPTSPGSRGRVSTVPGRLQGARARPGRRGPHGRADGPPRGRRSTGSGSAPARWCRSRSSPSPAATWRPSTRPCGSSRSTSSPRRRSPRSAVSPGSGAARARPRSGATWGCASTPATWRSSSRTPPPGSRRCGRAGIRVGKVQVSAGLRVRMDPGRSRRSWRRSGPSRRASTSTRWSSGGTAGWSATSTCPRRWTRRARDGGGPREWRIHFHVPALPRGARPVREHAGLPPRGARPPPARGAHAAPRGRDLHVGRAARGLPAGGHRGRGRPRAPVGARTSSGSGPDFDFRAAPRVDGSRLYWKSKSGPDPVFAPRAGVEPADRLDQHARRGGPGRRRRSTRAGWPLLALAFSLLYTGGMYLNDAFDRESDARERPERPIPSGRIGAGQVFAIGFGLLAAGVLPWRVAAAGPGGGGRAAVWSAVLLAAVITLYDAWHKANPLSPVVMGLCRVLVYVTAALAAAGRIGVPVCGWRRRAPLVPDRPHLRGQAGEPDRAAPCLAARVPGRALPLRVAGAPDGGAGTVPSSTWASWLGWPTRCRASSVRGIATSAVRW